MPFFNQAQMNYYNSSFADVKSPRSIPSSASAIKFDNLSFDDLVEVQKEAVNASSSPENLSKLQQDIAKLAGLNATIQKTFIDVGVKLQKVDQINPGEKFFGPWNALSAEFNDAIRESNATATNLGVTCQSFDKIVLYFSTGNDLTKEEKIELVKGFRGQVDRDAIIARGIKEKFDAIAVKVSKFGDRFDNFAKDELKEYKEQLAAIDLNITKLTEEIKTLERNITLAAVGLGLAIVGAAIAIAIFPAFAEAVLAAGASVVGGVAKQIFEWQAEIKQKKAQIDADNVKKTDLMKKIKELEEAQATLGDIRANDIPVIVGALSAFSGVWQEIETQLMAVSAYIEQGTTTPLIDVYIKEAHSVYTSLGEGLKDYGRAVSFNLRSERRDVPKWAKFHPAVEMKARELYCN